MSDYSTEDIVKYSISGDGARVKEAIQSVVASKIMTGMESKKAEVAQAMFNTVPVPEPKQEVADTFVASAKEAEKETPQ